MNELADVLSWTLYRNLYRIAPAYLKKLFGTFDFDLYGNATASYVPQFPLAGVYRARTLSHCPLAPLRSVAIPPWSQILPLVSGASDHEQHRRSLTLVLPYWPSQIWWPLICQLGPAWLLPGRPWHNPWSPASKQPLWQAVVVLLGPPSSVLATCYRLLCRGA